MPAIQIVTTTPSQEVAQQIAERLVENRLAGCVQIDGPVVSTYRWQGQIERDSEWRLTIKTLDSRFAEVEGAIRDVHPYDVPEVLATPVLKGNAGYLSWLAEQVSE